MVTVCPKLSVFGTMGVATSGVFGCVRGDGS